MTPQGAGVHPSEGDLQPLGTRAYLRRFAQTGMERGWVTRERCSAPVTGIRKPGAPRSSTFGR